MRHLLAAAAVVLAGCGAAPAAPAVEPVVSASPTPPHPVTSTSRTAPADEPVPAAACATLFRSGAEVGATGDQLECTDASGGTYIVGLFRCHDGTHLGSVDPTSGAPRGWFRAPGPFHPTQDEAANDPEYGIAYHDCTG